MTRDSADELPPSMVSTAVSATARPRPQRPIGSEPTYPLQALLALARTDPEAFAQKVGISRATYYRRVKHGVTWTEADEWAVAFGYLPFEVWPEWEQADPADWLDIPGDLDFDPPATAASIAA